MSYIGMAAPCQINGININIVIYFMYTEVFNKLKYMVYITLMHM